MTSVEIQQWLMNVCRREFGSSPERCAVRGPIVVRENSKLYYAECSAFSTALAIKLCLKPRTDESDSQSTRDQYSAMKRVYEAMGEEAEYAAPHPYLEDAGSGLLAMGWIDGATMTDLIFSRRCDKTRAQALAARAGRWLRRFHACHALAPGRLDVEAKLAYVEEMDANAVVSDRVFFRALDQLRRSAQIATAVTVKRSWIHGDFKTDNLMVSSSKTVGIDIHLRHESLIVYDLAPFLNYLELRRLHPSGWRFHRTGELLESTFVSSYFDGRVNGKDVPLVWVRLYLILAAWQSALEQPGSWLQSHYLKYCYRNVALRLTNWLAQHATEYAHINAA